MPLFTSCHLGQVYGPTVVESGNETDVNEVHVPTPQMGRHPSLVPAQPAMSAEIRHSEVHKSLTVGLACQFGLPQSAQGVIGSAFPNTTGEAEVGCGQCVNHTPGRVCQTSWVSPGRGLEVSTYRYIGALHLTIGMGVGRVGGGQP